MSIDEVIEILTALIKCKTRTSSGIHEDCNNRNCEDCDLCYMQGTVGEQIDAFGIAVEALKFQKEYQDKAVELFKGIEEVMTPENYYYNKAHQCVERIEGLKVPYRPQGTSWVECHKETNEYHNKLICEVLKIIKEELGEL